MNDFFDTIPESPLANKARMAKFQAMHDAGEITERIEADGTITYTAAPKRDLRCAQCGGYDGAHMLMHDCVAPWHVGLVVDPENPTMGKHLGRFETHDQASAFIETLPDYESGRYYLDGPEELINGPEGLINGVSA